MGQGELGGQVALVTGGAGGIGAAICSGAGAGGRSGGGGVFGPAGAGAGAGRAACPVMATAPCSPAWTTAPPSAPPPRVCSTIEGRLDLLVNNAGVTTPVAHEDLDGLTDDWIDTILRVNVRGAFACIAGICAAAQRKRQRPGGQHQLDRWAHRHGQQRRLLRQQSGAGLHDPQSGPGAGPRDPGAERVAGLGGRRLRPADAARADRRAGRSARRWAALPSRRKSPARCWPPPPC